MPPHEFTRKRESKNGREKENPLEVLVGGLVGMAVFTTF